MLVVPFSSDYDQRFTSQLGPDKYTFDARWSERGQIWTLDITRDADQVQLIAGVPLLAGQELLSPYALGIGGLVVTDLSQKDSDPGPDDLGDRVVIAWLSNDELAALRSALIASGQRSPIVIGVPPPLVPGDAGGATPSGGTGGNTTIVNTTTNSTTFNVTGGLGFSQYAELADASGDEILIGRFVQLPQLNPNPNVALTAAILAKGEGTVRFYTGGTFAEEISDAGTPSGSLRATQVVTGTATAYDISSSPFANPSASLAVKVTIQASSPGTPVGVDFIGGFVG